MFRAFWDLIVSKWEDFVDRLYVEDPEATRKMLERSRGEVEKGIQQGERGLSEIRNQLNKSRSDLVRMKSKYSDLSAAAEQHVEVAARLRNAGKEEQADREDRLADNLGPTLSALQEQIRALEDIVSELEQTEKSCSEVLSQQYAQKSAMAVKDELTMTRIYGRKILREATRNQRAMSGLLVQANSTLATRQRITETAERGYGVAREEKRIVDQRTQTAIEGSVSVEGRSIVAEMRKRAAAKYAAQPAKEIPAEKPKEKEEEETR